MTMLSLRPSTGFTTPRSLKGELPEVRISGLYLEFTALARHGAMSVSEPKLISPWKAVERYMASYDGLYPFPLIMLSQICHRVLKVAEETPPVKRGRRA